MSEELAALIAATDEVPNLLTENTPTKETHHMKCGSPWMPSQTAHPDGTVTSQLVCPSCGTSK